MVTVSSYGREKERLGVGGVKTQSVACREQDREGRAFPPLVVLMSVEEENGGRRSEPEGSLTETHFRESSGQANGCSFFFFFFFFSFIELKLINKICEMPKVYGMMI